MLVLGVLFLLSLCMCNNYRIKEVVHSVGHGPFFIY